MNETGVAVDVAGVGTCVVLWALSDVVSSVVVLPVIVSSVVVSPVVESSVVVSPVVVLVKVASGGRVGKLSTS